MYQQYNARYHIREDQKRNVQRREKANLLTGTAVRSNSLNSRTPHGPIHEHHDDGHKAIGVIHAARLTPVKSKQRKPSTGRM
jgi:hypothetical protein